MKFFEWRSRWSKKDRDITGLNCIKGASGKVIVDDKGIKDSWKEYIEKLMNRLKLRKDQQIASGWPK